MATPVIVKLKCLHPDCNHEWFPRTERKPLVCPRCKRYGWDVPHPKDKLRGGKKNVKKAHGPRRKETAIDRFKQQHESNS